MASKPGKEKKITGKATPDTESAKKESSKPKKQMEEEDDDDELEDDDADVKPAKKAGKAAVSSKKDKDEDDDDGPDEVDEWEKVEEEENWDPDFEEFDIPKSKGKKTTGVAGKKGVEEEEEFKVDDEFKDLFEGGDDLDEEDDDY